MNNTTPAPAWISEDLIVYLGDWMQLAGLILVVVGFFVLLGILSRLRQALEDQARGQQQTAEALKRILDRLDTQEQRHG